MTDHEIHLSLARWMGFEELPADPRAASRAYDRCRQQCTTAFEVQGDRLGMAGGGFWEPLLNPAQAALVMAAVAQRGGRVETTCQYGNPLFATAHVYLRRPDDAHPAWKMLPGSEAAENADPVIAWCQAVCHAVVAAIFNVKTEPGDQE